VWLNPFVADVDLLCTAVPDPFGATCSYTAILTGTEPNPQNPPRDAWWPRSVVALIVLGVASVLVSTQLIAPSRRWRRQPRPRSDPLPPAPAPA
jgi:hypothetical protein